MLDQADEDRFGFDARVTGRWLLDPLSDEEVGETVTLSDLAVLRIALVAIETGARFQREGIVLDPLAWMVTPRRMFDGRPPIEACVDADACSRAVLVHGLGLGLDPEAGAVAILMADDEFDEAELAA